MTHHLHQLESSECGKLLCSFMILWTAIWSETLLQAASPNSNNSDGRFLGHLPSGKHKALHNEQYKTKKRRKKNSPPLLNLSPSP